MAMNTSPPTLSVIPDQVTVSWAVVLNVSWGSLRRRFLRSMITMLGVVLAIAFLTYMLVTDDLVKALIALKDDRLNVLLQKAGVDIFTGGGRDTMMLLLIGLSLLTCLVGIVNAMLMSVTERIKEIGTLKCLGARNGFIVQTYFVESSMQGILGTLLGMATGLVVGIGVGIVAYGGAVLVHFPAGVVARSLGIALIMGTLMSVGASIVPAYWAAKKRPVDAMRVEE